MLCDTRIFFIFDAFLCVKIMIQFSKLSRC